MFRTTNEGVPYIRRAVGAEVPVAPKQAVGEEIGGSLLTAMVHSALARENAKLEEQQNLRQSDLAAKGLALKAVDQEHDYELKKLLYESYNTNADARLNSAKKGVAAFTDAAAARQAYQDSINEFDAHVDQTAADLKLTDPKYQNEDPVGWAAAREDFKRKFGTAVVGKAPGMIKQFDTMADQQTVPYMEGAHVVPGEYFQRAKGATPQFFPEEVKGGEQKDVPIWKIHQRYQQADDEGKAAIAAGLMAAGSGHIVKSLEKMGGKDVPSSKQELNPTMKGILTRKVDPSTAKNEVPELLTRKLTDKQAQTNFDGVGDGSVRAQSNDAVNDAPLPEPDLPPLQPGASISSPDGIAAPTSQNTIRTPGFTPSKTDRTLSQARAVVAANPQARDEVRRRLQGLGINPDLLNA